MHKTTILGVYLLVGVVWIGAMEQPAQHSVSGQIILDKAFRISAWFGAGMMKAFLEKGADPNCVDGDGMTLLMWAASEGNKNMVTTLLNQGAALEAEDKAGRTALWYAYRQPTKMAWSPHENQEIFGLLLKHGANINHRKKNGSTLLLNSTKVWHTFVPVLIVYEADITVLDRYGHDVLDRMQKAYEGECARTVCMQGDFRSPKEVQRDQKEAERIKEHFFVQPALYALDVVKKKFVERACAFLKCDFADLQASMILSRFCRLGDVQNVSVLLDAGADVNVVDAEGMTPLMHAVYAPIAIDCTQVIRLLLDNDAKQDLADKSGWTAKTHAIQAQNKIAEEFLRCVAY